jgi:hypothetical protein
MSAPIEQLLIDFKESLEREIKLVGAKVDEFRGEILLRFDGQSARLDRQAALIQSGSRWTTRMNEWNERIDKAMEARDKQISDLIRRIDKLEGKQPPAT